MLVLANGAFKSGSTWLREIVARIRPFEPLPAGYHLPRVPSYADPVALPKLLASGLAGEREFLSKSHIYAPSLRDLLLDHPHARVLNIRRDIRDTLVSHYFHMSYLGKVKGGFGRYYWTVGRLKAQQILDYHRVWSVGAGNVLATDYDRLKKEFATEVAGIGRFLGRDLDQAELEQIRSATSLDLLRSRAKEIGHDPRFFRDGRSGGWEAHFAPAMLEDLAGIEANGLDAVSRVKYAVAFGLRLKIKEVLAHAGGPLAMVAARI
jgi:hypothetical protein